MPETEITALIQALNQRLEQLSEKIDLLSQKQAPSAYPNQFISPKEALPYLKDISSLQGVYAACRSGKKFKSGTELIDTSPAGSERPTYLINVNAYFERLKKEQSS